MATIAFFNSYPIWGGGEKWHYTAAIFCLEQGHQVVAIVDPRGPLAQRFTRYYPEVKLVPFTWYKYSYFNPWQLLSLYRNFRRFRVESVVFNSPRDVRVGALVAKAAGVSIRIYRSGMPVPIPLKRSYRRAFCDGLTAIVPISQEIKRMINETSPILVAQRPIREVIANAVNLADFQQLLPQGKWVYQPQEMEIVLGNAARLGPQKGQEMLLEVVGRLLALKLPVKVKLLMAGDGELAGGLKQRAQELGISENVIFLGMIEDMHTFYPAIDIFLFSSLWEGTASALVEAMAYRKPIVCFNISSMPEMVKDGENGFLISPTNLDEFTAKVVDLILSPSLRQQMGDRGYQRVEQHFNMEVNYRRWLSLLTSPEGLPNN